MNNFIWFLLVFFTLMTTRLCAQEKKPDDSLRTQIAHMDSVLFNAFNNRDMETFKKMFTTDLEFYHDKGGLTNYAYTIQSFKNTIGLNNGLRRELVPGSLEVYPSPITEQWRSVHTGFATKKTENRIAAVLSSCISGGRSEPNGRSQE